MTEKPDAKGGSFTGYDKGTGQWVGGSESYSKGYWPEGGQQAKYQGAASWAPLANASFSIGPYLPFSFEWGYRMETGGAGSAMVPHSTPEPDYQKKLMSFVQATERESLLPANYLDMLEDAYPEGEAEDAEEYISKLLLRELPRGQKGVFDAKIEVPGEIASEMMALDPAILDLLAGSKYFAEDRWPHLNDIAFSPSAVKEVLGPGREYLDTSPLTPMGVQTLKVKLSALELAGIPREQLEGLVGGEETLDVSSKLISATLKKFSRQHFAVGGDVQGAVNATAKEIEEMINSFLSSDDRKKFVASRWPKWYKQLVPTSMGYDWASQKFEAIIDSRGIIGRVFYGSKGKMESTKATTKAKAFGEIRQLLRRTYQTEVMMSLAEYGVPGKGGLQGGWYYHVPGPKGHAAIFIIRPTGDLAGIDLTNAMMPPDLQFEITGYAIPAHIMGELMGSMDAILFWAGVSEGAWAADYANDFIARRNAHLGAFALQSIMNEEGWDRANEMTVDKTFAEMISQPIQMLKGLGTPKSELTTAIFTELIKRELQRFGKQPAIVQGIRDNIKKAFIESNDVTKVWKEKFFRSIPAQDTRTEDFIHELGGRYGVWSNQEDAIISMIGRGIAAAPAFGFSDSTIEQNQSILESLEGMKGQFTDMSARGRMLTGILESVEEPGFAWPTAAGQSVRGGAQKRKGI